MKRLVITGLPCPAEKWETFLGKKRGQRIIPIREVFEHCSSADPRLMSRYVTQQIEAFGPDSILCHDIGVPLTFLSLLRLQKKKPSYRPRVTVFNGAIRRVNLFKANHIVRVQFLPGKILIREVESKGGAVDPGLKPYLPRIKAMYRLILLFRLTESISSTFGLDELVGLPFFHVRRLKSPVQIIASPNDPYIPFESVRRLGEDFGARRLVQVAYGHFPYSVPRNRILPFVEEFEKSRLLH